MSDLPEVTLVTRTLQGADFVEALSVADGPRLEVPLGSRLAVEYQSGETPPVVHVELLAARVRFVDRADVVEPSWDRTRQLLLAAGAVLRGGTFPPWVLEELAASGAEAAGGTLAESNVAALGRLCEEHALAHAAPVPPLGPAPPDTEALAELRRLVAHHRSVPTTHGATDELCAACSHVAAQRPVEEHGVALHHGGGCAECLEVARALVLTRLEPT